MVSTIKRIFMVFFCVLVVLTSFIFSASAVNSTYEFNIPDPALNADGFLIQPVRWESGAIPALCIWWDFTCNFDDSTGSDVVPFVIGNLSEGKLTLTFGTGDSDKKWIMNLYTIYNGPTNSNNITNRAVVISYDESFTYTWELPSTNYFKKPTMYSGITDFNITTTANMTGFTYDAVFSGTNPLYTKLKEVNQHFTEMLLKADLTNEQLTSIVNKLDELLEVSYSTNDMLGEFVYYYWENFVNWELPTHISTIVGRLDNIYRLLNKQGEVEQTTVDTSKLDEFADVEQSLLNNDEAESAIGDMDVSIDGQAYSFIWDLVTRILNSHPEVFGLVITVLTLGFLALILNR